MMKKVAVAVSILLAASTPNAFAAGESIGSLSHIHGVRAVGNQIILGTHEGLFQYLDEKTVKRISPEPFDVMGLAVSTKGFYASGHPGPYYSIFTANCSCDGQRHLLFEQWRKEL